MIIWAALASALAGFLSGFLLGAATKPPAAKPPEHSPRADGGELERLKREYSNFLSYDGSEQS